MCSAPSAEENRCPDCGAPRVAGGFRILRQLAKTPHSRVFLAERDGRKVALKELLFALVPEASQLEAFERETALLRQLNHPRIPRFVDSFQEGSGAGTRLYLAQEFVDGGSLLEELARHRFDEREARRIAEQVLEVLGHLHSRSPRVIHRDVKPSNLMRRADGQLVLVDFGAARDLTGGVTHGSTLVGTFGYMPPEQLGGTVDATCDLYALGATLIHLLSQRPPDALMRNGIQLQFRDAVNVSAPMAGWLERLVAAHRSERFQSVEEASRALRALDQTAPKRPPVEPRDRRWVTVLGFCVGLAAFSAVAYMTTTRTAALVSPAPIAVTEPAPVAPSPPEPVAITASPGKPAQRAAPATRTRAPSGFEVVEVQELPAAKQVTPAASRLSRDVRIPIGQHVALADGAACTASLDLGRIELNAGATQWVQAPLKLRAVHQVSGTESDSGNCGVAEVALYVDGSRVGGSTLASTGREDKQLEFSVPRTAKIARLVVRSRGEERSSIDLDLVNATATPR